MFKLIHRFLIILSIVSISLISASTPSIAIPWQDKVDAWVIQTAGQGETEFLVYLTAQADLSAAASLPTKLDKGTYVYQTLLSLAKQTQAPVIAQLKKLGVEYHSYYIANMLWVKGGMSTIRVLAERADIAHIYANPRINLEKPSIDISTNSPPQAPAGIEWNISWVNAPQVWDLGYTGQGVVIGGQDTGYQWDHPALESHYRGWDGNSADHNYNWHDAIHSGGGICGADSPFPCDDYGHGTHTMGTMVGDDGGTNQIGMAPGAKWIGCRNMDQGAGTPATYTECYEWFIAPYPIGGNPDDGDPAMAPDVINNSWGCPPSEGCNPDSLLLPVQHLVAAGIVSAHSAGNSGSGCSTVSDPAAIYDESFTVGATGDHTNNIAGYSSRGPVLVDGSGRMKPDVSAPGSNIRSSVPGGGYQGGWSGTSMAGPHVAGAVALLISSNPALDGNVDMIESILEQSALHLDSTQCDNNGIPNNVYGWGRIDALAAVQANIHNITLEKVASQPAVAPGDLITYTLTISHNMGIDPTTNVVLTDTIPADTFFVNATEPYLYDGGVVRWDFASLDPQGSANVNLVVGVNITATGEIVNDNYAVRSDQVATVHGEPVITEILVPHSLQLSKVASSTMAFPGDLITYTLNITHDLGTGLTTNVVLADVLPAGSEFVSATGPYSLLGDTVRWDFPALDAQASQNVDLVVRVNMDATGVLANADYSVYSDQVALVQGSPVIIDLGKIFFLPLLVKGP